MKVKKARLAKAQDKYCPGSTVSFANAVVQVEDGVELHLSYMYKAGKEPKLIRANVSFTGNMGTRIREMVQDHIRSQRNG